MKVVHVIKKIEEIDLDIKELKKLEKSVKKNKSFSTPIYMSIEKQINIMLGERIKLLELKIENPPDTMVKEIEGEDNQQKSKIGKPTKKVARKKKGKKAPKEDFDDIHDEEIPMLTQEEIDARFSSIEAETGKEKKKASTVSDGGKENGDESVKILDIALEKGSLGEKGEKKERDKKVKFFRDNFPVE